MKKSWKFFSILLIVIAWFLAGKVYFQSGFPYTHDGESHLARFANYKIAVREGQIPPRFAPNLVNHYGYPVLNYNYPLANIFSLPFSFLKINYEITYKIIALSSIALGLWGINLWLRSLKFSVKSRVVASFVFALTPYLVNLTYFRGNIGELMALNIFPWLLYLVEIFISDSKKWNKNLKIKMFVFSSFVWAAFLLSHNITAFFGTAITLIYFIVRSFSKNKKDFLFIYSFMGGALMSLWFWLPAIFEKSEIVLDNSSFFTEFAGHFPTLQELLFSPLTFGFSKIGSVDTLGFSLGFIQIVFLLLSSILFIRNKNNIIRWFLLVSWLLVIFQLSFTKIIWLNVPLSSYIQFPWRLTIFFAVFILPLVAWSFDKFSKNWRKIIYFIIILQTISFLRLKPVDKFHRNNVDYEAFSQSTSTLNENTPKAFTYSEIGDWQPGAEVLDGKAKITTHFWNGSKRKYTVEVEETATIIEPTMNFIGWETADVDPRGAGPQIREKINYIDNEIIQGRIAFQLDPGPHLIETSFTQNTWPRKVGNILSGLTFLGMLILLIRNHTNYKKMR